VTVNYSPRTAPTPNWSTRQQGSGECCRAGSGALSTPRCPARSGGNECIQHGVEHAETVVGRAGERVDGVLGMRHHAHDPATRIADPGDVAAGAVRVRADVT